MNGPTGDQEGFGLGCKHCGHLFPMDVTIGVAAAHMEIEHDAATVEFDLAVLCPRCRKAMTFTRREVQGDGSARNWYDCGPCHRTRMVRQNAAPDGPDAL